MKKLLLLTFFILTGNLLRAQPWMPKSGTSPVKFADVLAWHEKNPGTYEDDDEKPQSNGKVIKEGKNYLFDRWEWYWRQHLDKDGYIVPPMKTLVEWQNYNATGKDKRTTAKVSNWVFQGPQQCAGGYSGLGRINTVAFDPSDSNTFFIGSAGGGTWKTTDGGITWAPMYDNWPTLGVADIKINPLNHNSIYVVTGDGDNSDAYSSGVIVSHDGGSTWLTDGLTWLPTMYNAGKSLLINPFDTGSMIFATNIGIFKTYNSGTSWTKVDTGSYKQILYNPADTNIVYGTKYLGASSQIMRSTDGGITWNAVTAFTDAQRINIAVCPASPGIVKAVASDNNSGLKGVYSSSDNGATYTAVYTEDTSCSNEILGYDLGLPTSHCGGQGWYDLCIAMNPADASQVTVGGVNTYYSSDGGSSWQIANQWYGGLTGVETVHADKHCLAYNNLTGALFETCDGGVYKNYAPLTGAWTNLTNGMGITEFYRNAVDNNVSFCIGGAQDNGTKMLNGGVSTDLNGGDGMQPLINYGDPNNIFYCSTQNGSINITRDGGATYHSITDTLHSSGGWLTPYVIHPFDTSILLLGYKQVFGSHNNGLSWTPLSPIFDTDDYINTLAIATTDPTYIYAVYNNYTIWQSVIDYTTNFGVTWDTIAVPSINYNFVSDLVIDPKNEKHFWVTIGGYGSAKVLDYNLDTKIWNYDNGTLPDIPANCMIIDTSSGTKYIGTDAAVFYMDTTMTNWALYNTNLPSVHVDDLHINYTTNQLWAATYGRGMWTTVKADTVVNTTFVPSLPMTADAITISPNPNHGSFTINASGKNFRAGEVTVNLAAADGKTVWHTTGLFDNNGHLKINTNGLASGFYICEVSNNSTISRSKVVIY